MRILIVAPPFAGLLDCLMPPMLAAKGAGHPVLMPSPLPLALGIAPRLSP